MPTYALLGSPGGGASAPVDIGGGGGGGIELVCGTEDGAGLCDCRIGTRCLLSRISSGLSSRTPLTMFGSSS